MKGKLTLFLLLFSVFCCAQTSPEMISGLQLWLRSDTGVVLDNVGKVDTWLDFSGQGNNASQSNSNFRPIPSDNALLSHPSVLFDGFNDWISFPEILDIRTVLWVVTEHPDATSHNRCLLGHDTNYDFFRGSDLSIWHSGFAHQGVLNGTTRVNFEVVDGTLTEMPHDFSIISLTTTADVSASRFSIDRDLFTSIWDGELLELIVFNQLLTNEQVWDVETYLADKYSPTLLPIDDIVIDYGFCDTTLCASPGFDSYLWNGQEVGNCYTASNSGQYVVEAIDRFGRAHADTVMVDFPGNIQFEDHIICVDSLLIIDPLLPLQDYSFNWQDGSTSKFFETSAPGLYQVEITDTLGCVALSNTVQIVVDSLTHVVSLGQDGTWCSGEQISLLDLPYPADSIWWNNILGGPSFPVEISGAYWVELIDVNGCLLQDTVLVDVVGEQPIPNFSVVGICFGDTSQFVDASSSISSLVGWYWMVDGAPISGDTTAVWVFDSLGIHNIVLEVINADGCSAATQHVINVYPLPQIDFQYTTPCENESMVLFDASEVADGSIDSYSWFIDGSLFLGFQIEYSFPQNGFVQIVHGATTNQGCSSLLSDSILVLPAPIINWNANGVCLGQLTELIPEVDASESGDILNYYWDFGDLTSSLDEQPIHLYTQAQVFDVLFHVAAQNGCSASLIKELEIHNLPDMELQFSQPCTGITISWSSLVDFNGGELATNSWFLDGELLSQDSAGGIIVSEEGAVLFQQQVTTTLGCQNTVDSALFVHASPVATVSISPTFGPAPLTVQFLGEGGEGAYIWSFGDGESVEGISVLHTFSVDGVFTGELLFTDSTSCSATANYSVTVNALRSDVLVEQILNLFDGSDSSFCAVIFNNSNFPVSDLELKWWLGNDASVSEFWQGELAPGSSLTYHFLSSPNPNAVNYNFLCVEVKDLTTSYLDEYPENNKRCISIQPVSILELYPPYPNPANEELRFVVMSSGLTQASVRVFSSNGLLLLESDAELQKGYNEFQLVLGAWAVGQYVIEVQSEVADQQRSFFIERR